VLVRLSSIAALRSTLPTCIAIARFPMISSR
jgi:hypothetical protein